MTSKHKSKEPPKPTGGEAGDFHHSVPAFMLRRFTGVDGKVFVLNLQTKITRRRPVGEIGGSIDLYSFPVATKDGAKAENLLQVVESDAARVIKKISKTKNSKALNPKEREKLARFIAVQSFRTDAFLDGLRSGSAPSREVVFSELWRSTIVNEREILSRIWFLMEIKSERQFIIGDHPITLQDAENPGSGIQLGFDVPGVEVFMPLTPKLALWLPPASLTKQVVDAYGNATRLHREARLAVLGQGNHYMANPQGLLALQRVLYSSKGIFDASHSGVPLIANEENVENFNSLQISFSAKDVFSQDGNFEFALSVLTETPSFSSSPITSLALALPNENGDN